MSLSITDPTVRPPQPSRWFLPVLLASAAATALLLASIAWYYRDAWLSLKDGVQPGTTNEVPTEVLGDYVPPDTVALLVVDLRQLRSTPALRDRVDALVRTHFSGNGLPTRRLALVGVDPLRDVDAVCLLVSETDRAHPLLLLRGRFDARRFQVAPGRLHAVDEETLEGRFRLYEHVDVAGSGTGYFAAAGTNYLLYGEAKPALVAALSQAANGKRTSPRDDGLRQALERLQGTHAVWGAARLTALRPLPRLEPKVVESMLRPIADRTARAEGSLEVAGDWTLRIRLEAASVEDAEELARAVQEACGFCKLALDFGGKDVPGDAEPLVRLLAATEFERAGVTVTLRGRVDPH